MCEYDASRKTPLDFLREGIKVPDICIMLGISKLRFFALYKADVITYIKELVAQGKTRKQIADKMGVNFDTVKKYKKMDENDWKEATQEQKSAIRELSRAGINPKGISSEMKIPIEWVYDALKSDILLKFVQSNLDSAIKRFGMDARTLTKIIKEEGFIIPSSALATRIIEHYGNGEFPFYKPMSNKLINKVEGEIEGDGHVRKNRDILNPTEKITSNDYKVLMDDFRLIKEAGNIEEIPNLKEKFNNIVKGIENVQITSFNITKAIKEFGWVKYIGKCFKDEGYKVTIRKYEEKCYLEVQSSVQLQELRDKWYSVEEKILPNEYKHNPTSLLHEYEGDGSYNRKSNRVNFSTHNFTEEEVHKIRNDIAHRVGIRPTVTKETKRDIEGNRFEGEYYYLVYINRNDDVEKFFQYLEKADKESLDMAKKVVPHKFPDKFLPPNLRRGDGLP